METARCLEPAPATTGDLSDALAGLVVVGGWAPSGADCGHREVVITGDRGVVRVELAERARVVGTGRGVTLEVALADLERDLRRRAVTAL